MILGLAFVGCSEYRRTVVDFSCGRTAWFDRWSRKIQTRRGRNGSCQPPAKQQHTWHRHTVYCIRLVARLRGWRGAPAACGPEWHVRMRGSRRGWPLPSAQSQQAEEPHLTSIHSTLSKPTTWNTISKYIWGFWWVKNLTLHSGQNF